MFMQVCGYCFTWLHKKFTSNLQRRDDMEMAARSKKNTPPNSKSHYSYRDNPLCLDSDSEDQLFSLTDKSENEVVVKNTTTPTYLLASKLNACPTLNRYANHGRRRNSNSVSKLYLVFTCAMHLNMCEYLKHIRFYVT